MSSNAAHWFHTWKYIACDFSFPSRSVIIRCLCFCTNSAEKKPNVSKIYSKKSQSATFYRQQLQTCLFIYIYGVPAELFLACNSWAMSFWHFFEKTNLKWLKNVNNVLGNQKSQSSIRTDSIRRFIDLIFLII